MRKGFQDTAGLCLPDGRCSCPCAPDDEFAAGRAGDSLDAAGTCLRKEVPVRHEPRLAVLRIGQNRPQRTILCEGYATGLSIKAACVQMHIEATVLVTFSDHNMSESPRNWKTPLRPLHHRG